MKKNFTIITGAGKELGTGHLQRMLNLLSYLASHGHKVSLLVNDHSIDFIPEHFKKYITSSITKSDLIIRDMRDSSADDIFKLKQYGPVLTIDDLGPGRDISDHKYDFLPNRINKQEQTDKSFIFGYNFSKSISSLEYSFDKDIDLAVYLGSKPDPAILSVIKENMNDSIRYLVVEAHGKVTGNFNFEPSIQYSEILCRSKFFITYFGISLFEADLCNCKLITLDPSKYHRQLTEMIENSHDIVYATDLSRFNADEAISIRSLIEGDKKILKVDTSKINNKVISNIGNFYKFLISLT